MVVEKIWKVYIKIISYSDKYSLPKNPVQKRN